MSSAVPTSFDTVRQLALALPEVTEGTSYGTPAFHVRGKLLARLRGGRSGASRGPRHPRPGLRPWTPNQGRLKCDHNAACPRYVRRLLLRVTLPAAQRHERKLFEPRRHRLPEGFSGNRTRTGGAGAERPAHA
jgi:hypothetical protein